MIGKTNSQTGGAIKGEKLNVSLSSNQADKSDLLGAIITVTHPGGTTEYAWEGHEITVDIPPYVEYSVSCQGIEGYKTPDAFTSTAVSENSRTLAFEYLGELVSVQLSTDDGASAVGQTVTVNGKAHTYSGSAIEQLVPYGTDYTVSVNAKEYYATPSTVSRKAQAASYPVTLTYKASRLTLAISSNQGTDSTIAAVKATVTWTGTSKSVGNGETIYIPADKTVTVAYPSVEGYAQSATSETINNTSGGTVSESVTYSTTVVTASIKSNQSDTSDLADATLTVGGKTLKNGETAKIATGTSVTPSWSSVSGYKSPDNTSAVTLSGTAKTIEGTYKCSAVTVTLADNQSSYNDISSAKATVTGDASATLSSGETVKVPWGGSISIAGSAVSGYTTPSATFTANVDTGSVTLTYNTEILTVAVGTDGTTPTGYTVTVVNADTGATIGSQTTASATYKIPSGTKYYVKASAVSGFNAPANSSTVTASSGSDAANSVTMTYAEIKYETLTVSTGGLSSGFTITVKDSGGNTLGTSTSTTATFSIVEGTAYTVSASAVTGYNVALSGTNFTAVGGNARSVTVTYTLKTYTLTVNVSGLSSGFSVTVKYGSTTKTQTATSATYTVSHGVSWSVTGGAVNGYNVSGGTSGTMTSNNSVTITYTLAHTGTTSPSNGVYIMDTDGYYHTSSEWDGTYTPNGIAVITSSCRFVMALANAYSSYCAWGGYGTTVSGIVTTTSEGTAQGDYAGDANTTQIISQLGASSAPAANYCRSYTFPNGATGYLGAAGEWQAALDNKSAIATALTTCGGTAMSNYYWTSTQYSSYRSWYMSWTNEYLDYYTKGNHYYVRAFAAI